MEKLIFLDRLSDLTPISEACRLALTRLTSVRTAQEDQTLNQDQQSLLLIISGIARVFVKTDDGKDVTQYFVRAEDFVLPNVDSPRNLFEYVEAITEVTYVQLPFSDFERMMTNYPELTTFLGAHLNDLALRVKERNQRRARKEPADTYASFLQTYPGLELQVPTAHLASYLGLSTSEFMRARQKYKARGIM
jgi:CRP-like cAMP-binding protein